jgi:hypothetical protein
MDYGVKVRLTKFSVNAKAKRWGGWRILSDFSDD